MNKWLEIIVGLVLVVGSLLVGYYSGAVGSVWSLSGIPFNFLEAAWTVLLGGIWWMVLGVGIIFILIGISDIQE